MTRKRLVAALSLPAVLLAGMVYETIGERLDRGGTPRVGQAIDIGGRTLNRSCLGNGSPTIILDSGGTSPGSSNVALQRVLANGTATCWFDRDGLGWSDPSPILQTSAAIAKDLHELLRAAHIPRPVTCPRIQIPAQLALPRRGPAKTNEARAVLSCHDNPRVARKLTPATTRFWRQA
jgi:hypothetical protein